MSNYQGIVLSSKEYKENDKLITCLVRDLGKINIIIENSNDSSTNFALSEPLCLIDFSARKMSNSDCLYYIYQSRLKDAYKEVRNSQVKLAYAIYFLNLVASLIDYCEVEQKVFDYTKQYLNLNKVVDESEIGLYTTIMSIRLLAILGLGAMPKWCFMCDEEHQEFIYITESGLSLCKSCVDDKYHVKIAKDRWRSFAESEMTELIDMDFSKEELTAIELYIKGIVGKDIKGYKYLNLIR
ncbi:MAG: DNA repair protein RecO [Clostridia bacterium]